MTAQAFLDLPPLTHVAGTVRLPGSKSISNRVLLLAGFSAGRTRIDGLLDSDDTRVMLAALRTLGCTVQQDGDAVEITGLGGRLPVAHADLFLGNAGTAMRPLTAAVALALLAGGGAPESSYTLRGVPRMHERPIGDLLEALRALGCRITCLEREGYPPLRIETGALRLDAAIKVRGDVSSQFLTALLMALPLVASERPVTVEVEGELISKPYIGITIELLARFGILLQRDGWQRFTIPAGSALQTPGQAVVEGDASSASYFIAAGAIAADGAPLRIEGVGSASIQGDVQFVDAARHMGADVTLEPLALVVRRGRWPLTGITLDCNHIPDAAMTLAMMALYADGPTRLTNIASWRVKETDRIAAMATELRKLGATVFEGEDFIEVTPPPSDGWQAAAIGTYDDHRMAMCASLAAFNGLASGHGVPVRVLDPGCVSKTFPTYFGTLFGVAHADAAAIPVITIDGPTACGKGTLASGLAEQLGYHHLDSGALYRATAFMALERGVKADDEQGLAQLARHLPLRFEQQHAVLGGFDVTDALRQEQVGNLASRISAWPAVRQALLDLQLSFRRLPGLVADGRDMGTVVFPDAALKVFLTASAQTRAERRYKQLMSKGIPTNIDSLRADLEARDARDQNRSVSPLKPAMEARLFDNSAVSIDDSVVQVLGWWQSAGIFPQPAV